MLFEALGAFAAVLALVALIFAYQSANSARKQVELQTAALQPVFAVFFDGPSVTRSPGVGRDPSASVTISSMLRVVRLSGAYLDAVARERTIMVTGLTDVVHDEDEYPPGRQAALIPLPEDLPTLPAYWQDTSAEGTDPLRRGLEIGSWRTDEGVHFHNGITPAWEVIAGRRAAMDFVTIVEVAYRDISGQGHRVFFKVGGEPGRYGPPDPASPPPSLRAPTIGEECAQLFDRRVQQVRRALRAWRSRSGPNGQLLASNLSYDGELLRAAAKTFAEDTGADIRRKCG